MTKHWFHQYLIEYYSKGKKLAIDLGCGIKNYDANFKCEYIGIDLPTYFNGKTYADVYSDVSFLPFSDNSFDLAVSYSVLPLVNNLDKALDEMHRVLKHDGVGVIVIMNLKGLALQPNRFFNNRLSSKILLCKLKEHGFRSILHKNIKTWIWSTWFDKTSVYGYAVVTPLK